MLNTLHNQTFPNIVAIKNLEKEIDYWSEQEDMKWRQRVKKEWYKGGDKNTKFFHACATQRRSHNNIQRIKNHNGTNISGQVDI